MSRAATRYCAEPPVPVSPTTANRAEPSRSGSVTAGAGTDATSIGAIPPIPDDAAALAIVATSRRLAPGLHVITRASTWEGGRHLKEAGATAVVRPELEGGIEIVRRTLLGLRFPAYDVQRYTDAVRREELGISSPGDDRAQVLEDLAHAVGNLDVAWIPVGNESPVAGRTLAESNVRARTGASIVAIGRGGTRTATQMPHARGLPRRAAPPADSSAAARGRPSQHVGSLTGTSPHAPSATAPIMTVRQ